MPTLRLLSRSATDIEAVARRIAPELSARLGDGYAVEVVGCMSQVGSGALPVDALPSAGVAIRPAHAKGSGSALAALAAALRALPVPVIGRVTEQALVLDCRCLEDEAGFHRNMTGLGLP